MDNDSLLPSSHARRVLLTEAFTPTDDQVEDISRFLQKHMEREDMNPVALAAGAKSKVIEWIRQAVNEGHITGIGRNPPEAVVRGLYEYTLGLGVIESLLANPAVEQINLCGPKEIFVQANGTWGKLGEDDQLFRDQREYMRVIRNLARRARKELSPHTHPILDIRFDRPVLRIHINQTVRGGQTAVFIRRGRTHPFTIEYLIKAGNFDRQVADLLIEAAQRLIGCIFIGPVGTGKTVMLEAFINHMPNVPIVVADDAGDCTPTHPFCLVNELPATAYSTFDQQIITLGSMVKAALREGDVMVVAEIRGAEEAGITVSNAPGMRCVATTFHGNAPQDGLSRLVSLTQTPPSPYAGLGNVEALARDIASAFPLVVQLDRSGDKRFVSGVYHNRGWRHNQWDLSPLVETNYHPSGVIEWRVAGDLDEIRPVRILDTIGRIRHKYDASDPRQLYTRALTDIEAKDWRAAKHRLYQCLLMQDTETVRSQLIYVLEQTGEAAKAHQDADQSAQLLRKHIENKHWSKARQLINEINQRPVRAFIRKVIPDYPQILLMVDQGEKVSKSAEGVLVATQTAVARGSRWDIAEMILEQIADLDVQFLESTLIQELQRAKHSLLDYLVEKAPAISRDYFVQLRARP